MKRMDFIAHSHRQHKWILKSINLLRNWAIIKCIYVFYSGKYWSQMWRCDMTEKPVWMGICNMKQRRNNNNTLIGWFYIANRIIVELRFLSSGRECCENTNTNKIRFAVWWTFLFNHYLDRLQKPHIPCACGISHAPMKIVVASAFSSVNGDILGMKAKIFAIYHCKIWYISAMHIVEYSTMKIIIDDIAD